MTTLQSALEEALLNLPYQNVASIISARLADQGVVLTDRELEQLTFKFTGHLGYYRAGRASFHPRAPLRLLLPSFFSYPDES